MFTLWPTVRLITWLILAMGRRAVAVNFFIGLRIPKKRMKFLQLLAFLMFIQMIFSRYDNLEVDRLLLAQLVCDTIQSLCEYLMTYPSLMEEIFLKRTSGVGGGTPHNGLYGEAPPKRNTLFGLQVYERVGIY